MCSPSAILVAQSVRFALAGVLVALIYAITTAVLAKVAGVPFQLALAAGFFTAIVVHYTLQRFFVWAHVDGYALAFRAQFARYVTVSGAQYVLTAIVTGTLPAALHVTTIVVYLVWTACSSIVSFVVLRRGIFHPRRPTQVPPE